jgi:hypothetical protein
VPRRIPEKCQLRESHVRIKEEKRKIGEGLVKALKGKTGGWSGGWFEEWIKARTGRRNRRVWSPAQV